jgi:hypothetical protein
MPLTRATIRQYEAFLAIADLHSISAAADRLGLTSSAVSQLLAELETELDATSFLQPKRYCATYGPPNNLQTISAITRPALYGSVRHWCSRAPPCLLQSRSMLRTSRKW